MRNLEIKTKYKNQKKLVEVLAKLGAKKAEDMHQVDTYFNVQKGRLKLRELGSNNAYLIFYERSNIKTQRFSNYYTYQVSNQKEFKNFWKKALGIKIVVDKKRILYMYKNARIHVDTVKSLGTFMEIEVLVTKGNMQAKKLMKELLDYFNISQNDFIKESYSDLLLTQ